MPIEKYSTIVPAPGQGLRVMKSKLLTALGATGVLRPYTANPERIIERKILLQNAFNPSAGGGGVTPPPPPPTLPQTAVLILQLESLDFDNTANGTQINLWTDKSGGGHTFNLAGPALNANPAQPTVDGTILCNGHKTLRFNNNAAIGIANFGYGNTGQDLIIVYKTDLPVVGGGVVEGLMRINQATNNAQPFTDNHFYAGFARTDRPNIGQPVTSMANFVAFELSSKSDNSAYNAWINSENFFSSGTYTYNNIQNANQTTLGGGYTGVINQFLSGNIAAVYIWNTVLSSTDRTQARSYINFTWGVVFP